MKVEDVTIIGSGPAGIAAAVQLKRSGISPLLLEKEEIGGLLRNANLVENYPGFPNGISGLNLEDLFRKQLEKVSVRPRFEEVIRLDFKKEVFLIETQEKTFRSRIVVIATGTKPKEISDFSIPEGAKDRIFYEIHSILNVQKKKIVIIGAGDAAFDYALNLSQNNRVTILNREKEIRGLPSLWHRAKAISSISYYRNTEVLKVSSNARSPIVLECKNGREVLEICADYLVFAIGREPQLDRLSRELKEKAPALVKKGILYFVGDVKNKTYRQTAIAVGDGVMAAMKICEKLKKGCLPVSFPVNS